MTNLQVHGDHTLVSQPAHVCANMYDRSIVSFSFIDVKQNLGVCPSAKYRILASNVHIEEVRGWAIGGVRIFPAAWFAISRCFHTIAETFSGSAQFVANPSLLTTCMSQELNLVLQKAHFYILYSLSVTVSKRLLCSTRFAPKTRISSTRQRTLSNPTNMLFIPFWNNSAWDT